MATILRRRLSVHLAAWFGLLTGFGEVICLGVRKFLLRQPIYFGLHIVWMSPLANFCLFTLLGLLLSSLRINSLRVKASMMAFFGLFGCALVFDEVKAYAGVSLAAGVAPRRAVDDPCVAGPVRRRIRMAKLVGDARVHELDRALGRPRGGLVERAAD